MTKNELLEVQNFIKELRQSEDDVEVMEIAYEEYKEWWENNYHCLGIAGL